MRLLDATMAVVAREGAQAIPEGLSAWCRDNGIPRATAYRHLQRIKDQGSWTPQSRRPDSCPHATPQAVVDEVIAIRERLVRLEYADYGADVVREWSSRTSMTTALKPTMPLTSVPSIW